MPTRKIGTCISCGRLRTIYYREHCESCYVRLGLNSIKVVCTACGEKTAHQAKGLCYGCYHNQYIKRKWREDPVFRKKKMDYIKKYNKEHAEEILAYARDYQKKHGRKPKSKKFGYLCGCGQIVTTVISNNKSKKSRKIMCPFCRRRDRLQPCYYNRFTREIVKMCEKEEYI